MKKIIYCIAFIIAGMKGLAQDADLFWKSGHKSEIISISISPDNKYFLTVEKDTLAIIWDIASGQQLLAIKYVEGAAFRDNNSIYLAMTDKTFKLVDLLGQTIELYSTKQKKYKIDFKYNDIPRIFYPENGLYFFGGNMFDMKKGYQRYIGFEDWVVNSSTTYSPVAHKAVLTDDQKGRIVLIDMTTGKTIWELKSNPPDNGPFSVSFSQDGEKIIVTGGSFFHLIDVASGTITRTIKNVKWKGEEAKFSPDGKKLILVSKNYDTYAIKVSQVDVETNATDWTREYKDISFFVRMEFSPDGSSLAFWINGAPNQIERISLINTKTGADICAYKNPDLSTPTYEHIAAFSPDGQKFILGNSEDLILINAKTGSVEKKFTKRYLGSIYNIQFTKDNKQLVHYANDYITCWNMETGVMEKSVPAKDGAEWNSPFAAGINGKSFFLIHNKFLREIDTAGKLIHQYGVKKMQYRTGVQLSYDGQYVMCNGEPEVDTQCKEGNTLEVFDTKTKKLLFTKCIANTALFLNNKNVLVTWGNYKSKLLHFYELPSGKHLYDHALPDQNAGAEFITFSPHDNYFTVKGENVDGNTVVIIGDLKTKKNHQIAVTVPAAIPWPYTSAEIRIIGFTPDEKHIIYHSDRTGAFIFLDIENKRFDESMTILKPGGISSFSNVKVSPDGAYLLLGTYSGTIMLYDLKQRKVQGTLYPDAANKNWAVVTAAGSFDANSGAQTTMYHITGSTVVPLSAVFEQFYTPRLLPRILSGEQLDPSPVDVNKLKKAPVVKINFTEGSRNLEVDDDNDVKTINTKNGTGSMAITADCPLDGVTEIRLYQNGKLVETTRNLIVEDENAADKSLSKTFGVELVEGTNRFRAVAYNTERTESKPVELHVIYKSEKPTAETKIAAGIQLHVVVVGINIYKNAKYNLNYAQPDAEAFKKAITNGGSGIYSNVHMHFVQDAEASRTGITAALNKVKSAANAADVFVFYYAGHGVLNDKKEFYLVPSDVTQLYGNDNALAQNGISAATLQQFSKDIKAQKQLFILDACQSSGALDNIVALRGAAEEKAIAQLARSTGTHWLTASGSTQFASEFSQLGHGAFTFCLLEAAKGAADNGDKTLTVKELDAYLQSKVPEITQKYKGSAQYPASYGYGNDFPLIIIK